MGRLSALMELVVNMESRQLGEQGLEDAMVRLDLQLKSGTHYEVPFSECLFWIYALHEWHKAIVNKAAGRDKTAFWKMNEQSEEGKTLLALVFTRSEFVGHRLLSVSHPDRSRSSILGADFLGSGPGQPVWTAEANLKSNREGDDADPRRQLYKQLVANQPILKPLEVVQKYLTDLQT